jgi:hypothetical protein
MPFIETVGLTLSIIGTLLSAIPLFNPNQDLFVRHQISYANNIGSDGTYPAFIGKDPNYNLMLVSPEMPHCSTGSYCSDWETARRTGVLKFVEIGEAGWNAVCIERTDISISWAFSNPRRQVTIPSQFLIHDNYGQFQKAWNYAGRTVNGKDPLCIWLDGDSTPCNGDTWNPTCLGAYRANVEWIGEGEASQDDNTIRDSVSDLRWNMWPPAWQEYQDWSYHIHNTRMFRRGSNETKESNKTIALTKKERKEQDDKMIKNPKYKKLTRSIFISDLETHDPRVLCESDTSFGSSLYNNRTGLLCDLAARELYDVKELNEELVLKKLKFTNSDYTKIYRQKKYDEVTQPEDSVRKRLKRSLDPDEFVNSGNIHSDL